MLARKTRALLLNSLDLTKWRTVKGLQKELDILFQIQKSESSLQHSLVLMERRNIAERRKAARGSYEWRLLPNGVKIAASMTITRPSKRKSGTRTSSKGSSVRTSTVTMPPNKPTFIMGVQNTINRFISFGQKFSAHDVTDKMRDELSDGSAPYALDPNEVGNLKIQGRDVPRIKHAEVREVVHDYYLTNKMIGYKRTHNGQYFEYVPDSPAPVVAAVAPDPDPVPPVDGGSYTGDPSL